MKPHILLTLAVAACAADGDDDANLATTASGVSLVTINVAVTDTHQTIDGFGAAQPGGDRSKPLEGGAFYVFDYPEPYRSQVMDLGFSQVKGIGLTILRMRIEAMMERVPGVWNDVDPGQAWVMQQAVARGPVKIMATAWSPPGWMKDNGASFGGRCSLTGEVCVADRGCWADHCVAGRLATSHYQEFADLLAHFVGPFAAANQAPIYGISMTNEPDGGLHDYDACDWSNDQLADFLGNYLAPTLAAAHSTTRVIAPESSTWNADALLTSTYWLPSARNRVDIVAGHLYGGNPAQPFQTALLFGKRAWQTETSRRHDIWTIDGALGWAKDIHDGLTGAQISAWLWFIMFAGAADMEQGGLIGVLPGGGIKGSPTFYALGNFSKFVRPGFVRIGATATWLLDVSAYKDPASDQVVVVAINRNAQPVDVKLTGVTTAQTVTAYVTSATQSLQRQRPVAVATTMRMPAQSIVTFVTSSQGLNRTSDILWHNVQTNEFSEWLMANGNVAAAVPLFTEPAEWRVQGIGDLNGDGTSDVLWRSSSTGELTEWLMADGQVIGPELHLFAEPAEWQVQGIGDFNGDGTGDILWRNVTTGEITQWIMANGYVVGVIPLFTQPAEWQVQSIGDFNGDGTSDVLWHNVRTGELVEWLMSNGYVVGRIPLYTEPAEWHVQGVGDFNHDGTTDILWHNVTTGQFSEWLMSNGYVGTAITLFTEPAEWQVQGIGDFNGDGTSDVLWRNVTTGQFVEWLMSNGYVGGVITLYTEPAAWQVQGIGDFNGR